MLPEQAKEIFEQHKRTGEPLMQDEVLSIVAAKLADETDFWHSGGGLFRYDPDTDPNLPSPDDQPDNEEETFLL